MTKYKLVALSDFHLGHESCMLRNEGSTEGLNKVINSIITNINGPKIQQIETLVLIGDIIDTALSKANEMCEAAGNFFRELTNKIEIAKIVILPGNHDRILLKDAIETVQNSGKKVQYSDGVFPVDGIDINSDRTLFNAKINYYQNLSLLQLYGLKDKQNQLNIENQTSVYFANPIYYEKIGDKSLIFNHGMHIYSDVSPLISKSKTLNDLENNIVDSMTFIWNNRQNQDITIQKSLWTGVQFLQAQLLKFRNRSNFKYEPWILLKRKESKRIWIQNLLKKIFGDPKLEFLRILWIILKGAPDKKISKNNMIFVWGHTHTSEFKEYYINTKMGTVLSCNTGSWCSWHKSLKPDSCIFTINNSGPKLWRYQYPKKIVEKLAPF